MSRKSNSRPSRTPVHNNEASNSTMHLSRKMETAAQNDRRTFKTTEFLRNKCLDFDMYGRRVTLTFHGHEKFRTQFGAFCTILIAAICLMYALFKLSMLFGPKYAVPLVSEISPDSFYRIFGEVQAGI